MTYRVTPLMQKAEERLGGPLDVRLPDAINKHGVAGAAAMLDVSKTTINYWLLKLNIRTERIAISPRETIAIKRSA